MSEFTVVNPPRRSRSHSENSEKDGNLVGGSAQEPAAEKEKTADDIETDSDKENPSKTPGESVHQGYEMYELSTTKENWKINHPFYSSRVIVEDGNNTDRDLREHDSIVPEYLRLKKYDLKPPPAPSRDQITAAAERLVSVSTKRGFGPESSNKDADYTPSLASTPKRRKQDISKRSPNTTPETSPRQVTIVNGRTTITTSKPASKLQKVIHGFPLPQDPYPADFTLTELCTQYPNHLFGDNLHPFLQYKWSAAKIAKLLPDQSQVAEKDQITANAMASRLRKTKSALERLGSYTTLMNGPKTHLEP